MILRADNSRHFSEVKVITEASIAGSKEGNELLN
jgi:hypothetical protein